MIKVSQGKLILMKKEMASIHERTFRLKVSYNIYILYIYISNLYYLCIIMCIIMCIIYVMYKLYLCRNERQGCSR